jgi:hypothetical protein
MRVASAVARQLLDCRLSVHRAVAAVTDEIAPVLVGAELDGPRWFSGIEGRSVWPPRAVRLGLGDRRAPQLSSSPRAVGH